MQLLIGTASALAFAALPLQLESVAFGSLQPAAAFAKNGNGNGGGNGNGHGGGNGGGKGHSGERGKSGDAGGRGKSGLGLGSKPLKTIFGQETHGAKTKVAKASKSTETRVAKASKKSTRAIEVAALPEEAPIPVAKPKEHKLSARLAGLNSLKRNYHAYLNSKSPRMASIQAFVMASANLDLAKEELANAQAEFDARLAAAELEAYDDNFNYDDATLSELQDRLDYLSTVNDPAADDERAALQSLLDSREADDLAAAEDKVDLAEEGTDDEALRQALLDGANKNRVAQYGEQDYVNEAMMDWAKDVLGVGDEVGKIDEVRDTLEIDQQ
jgi:hypothetical protein